MSVLTKPFCDFFKRGLYSLLTFILVFCSISHQRLASRAWSIIVINYSHFHLLLIISLVTLSHLATGHRFRVKQTSPLEPSRQARFIQIDFLIKYTCVGLPQVQMRCWLVINENLIFTNEIFLKTNSCEWGYIFEKEIRFLLYNDKM